MRLLLNEDENVSQNYLLMFLTMQDRMAIMIEGATTFTKDVSESMPSAAEPDAHTK